MNLIDKLSPRTTDYVAVVDVDPELAKQISMTVKGLVCVGMVRLKDFKHVKKLADLDESAFDRMIVYPGERPIEINEILHATEHMGYVLLCNVKSLDCEILRSGLADKGMFEFWTFENDRRVVCDVLFRVRKYNNVFC